MITTGAMRGNAENVNDWSAEQREQVLETKSRSKDINVLLTVPEERRAGAADHEYAVLFCLLGFRA